MTKAILLQSGCYFDKMFVVLYVQWDEFWPTSGKLDIHCTSTMTFFGVQELKMGVIYARTPINGSPGSLYACILIDHVHIIMFGQTNIWEHPWFY